MKKELFSPKVLAVSAMLAALSIICGKYFAFNIGTVLRFSLENLPILFAGIVFGPVHGMLVGAVADLVGCLLVGYEINPLVTLGAVSIGGVSGLLHFILKKMKIPTGASITVSIIFAHVIGSVLIKTFGLAAYYDFPFYILMLWRAVNYLVIGILECLVILTLMKNRGIASLIISIKEGRHL